MGLTVDVILYNPSGIEEHGIPHTPLSLLAIGSSLKEAGYEVKIIDGRVEKNKEKIILKNLSDALCFCVSCMTGSPIKDALRMSKLVKEHKNIPIIWGGFHPSLAPEQTIKNPFVDVVVKGQGEITIVELLDAIKNKKSFEGIKGIVYKNRGKIVENSNRPIEDLDSLPRLDYSLIDVKKYIRVDVNTRTLDYITGRGCPHRCSFCAISRMHGKTWKTYSVERVIDEITDLVEKYDINGLHIMDDNFFIDKKRVERIVDELMRRKLKIRFWTMCRVDYFSRFDDKFLKKIKRAGFIRFNFGAESGSQRILDKIQKDITVEQTIRTARLCNKHGLNAEFSFMVGLPFETKEDFEKTLDLMDNIHSINPNFDMAIFVFTPSPGTLSYERAIKAGFEPPKTLEEWGEYDYGKEMPWRTKEEENLYRTLGYLSWFAYSPGIEKKLRKWYLKLGYKILHKIALWRWKYRFFGFPVEWRLVEKYVKI